MVSPLSARLLSLSAIASLSSSSSSSNNSHNSNNNAHSTSSSACSTTSSESGDSGTSSGHPKKTQRKRITYSNRQHSLEVMSEGHRSSASSEDGSQENNSNSNSNSNTATSSFASRYKRLRLSFDPNISGAAATTAEEDSLKRFKLAEIQYDAATAKSVLEHAGKPSQLTLCSATTRSSRVLPLGSLDMTNVRLQSSSSSFPTRNKRSFKSKSSSTTPSYESNARSLTEMVHSTRPMYKFPRTRMITNTKSGNISSKVSTITPTAVPTEDESLTGSDTNAASDTESDDSQEHSIALGIPARLEDAIAFHKKHGCRTSAATSTNTTTTMTQAYKEGNQANYDCTTETTKPLIKHSISALMSLGEALLSSSTARIVTEAKAPFVVVHANAAYTKLTGINSNSILGRPISKVLISSPQDQQRQVQQELSLSNCSEMASIGKDIFVRIATQSARTQEKIPFDDDDDDDDDDKKKKDETGNDENNVVTIKESAVCRMNVSPVIPDSLQYQHCAVTTDDVHMRQHEDSSCSTTTSSTLTTTTTRKNTIKLDEVTHYSVEIVPFNILSTIKDGETKSDNKDAIYKELCYDVSEKNYYKGSSGSSKQQGKDVYAVCKSVQKQGLVVMG